MSETVNGTAHKDLLSHYARLIEISKQLNSTFDHKALLKQIISAATELTNTEEASIMLYDPTSGELRFEIATNMVSNNMQDIMVPLEGSLAGWIFSHGEPRVIQDVSKESLHSKVVDDATGFKSRNLLGVPMKTHKKVIGVLEALNKRDGERFTDEDTNTLTTLAGLAAIAIENARLFRQSDFIAEMVHELRTPLLALKASTALLMRPDLPEERREDMITTMQEETNRLMRLTTDFLDLAQMESGRTRLEIAPFDLAKLLAESAVVVMPQATEKGITITTDEKTFTVDGDRGKIKQVLLNLLTNAIKYNRRNGKITASTTLDLEDDTPMVIVAIADTGYGISKESQKRMFEKFFRADNPSGESGTGLGLVITKHIVEAHGGSIWLESEEGVGTTFFITLPLVN
ncbi:MAG: GAF domain-containing sensor histidine kinase [bacterium]|nr:GAF domain-containing sensor histidine kinase [bacterium]